MKEFDIDKLKDELQIKEKTYKEIMNEREKMKNRLMRLKN
jgi:hypothetical protein